MKEQELMDAVRLIDKILTSESDNIKNAWRELLIVVALTESPTEEGPLTSLLAEIQQLRNEVRQLRNEVDLEKRNINRNNWYGPGKYYNDNSTIDWNTVSPYTTSGTITGSPSPTIGDLTDELHRTDYIHKLLGDTFTANQEKDDGK
jgi:hypothetical protein